MADGTLSPSGSARYTDTTDSLPRDRRHGQWPEPRPGRWRAHGSQPRVTPANGPFEHGLERGFPAVRKSRDPQRAQHLLAGMPWQVEQRVNLGDRHRFRPGNNLDDLV